MNPSSNYHASLHQFLFQPDLHTYFHIHQSSSSESIPTNKQHYDNCDIRLLLKLNLNQLTLSIQISSKVYAFQGKFTSKKFKLSNVTFYV